MDALQRVVGRFTAARRTVERGLMDEAGPILVVDQDDGVRVLVSSLLAAAGFGTAEAETGEIALALARAVRPRLALVDVYLPGLSGYEVCHRLKAEFGAAVPVVLVSRETREKLDEVAGMLLGADDCMTKPFLADELLDRVRQLLLTSKEVPGDDRRAEDAGEDGDGIEERRHQSYPSSSSRPSSIPK
jgi:DNA-binding response OmpR family regulator